MKHSRRNHHMVLPTTVGERLYSIIVWPFLLVLALVLLLKSSFLSGGQIQEVNFHNLILATGYTLARLFSAYFLALIISVPLAMLTISSSFAEKIFLPLFDVLESVPILAFFPILILFFINIGFTNGAAVFIIFLTMLWNIVFTVVGGLKMIPKDITFAAKVFGIKGWNYFRQVILPSIFPEIVTGSILAFAQGWNLIIVAEVIHTYIPNGTSNQDLFGIGSILVDASAKGETVVFVACLGVMIVTIALFNYFVWQNLIHYSEKFKFE